MTRIRVTRRAVLTGMTGLAALAAFPVSASPDAALQQLKDWTKASAAKPGRVKLVLPEVADNGNAVPLEVAVESPMSEADYVRSIHIVADGNPHPAVASFHLTPANGRAHVTTRFRLAKSQRVTAWAVMNDGSVWGTRAAVTVTIGGCGAG
ncbi:MAG: thiosulfate oxidation carrier protein SoxY [Alphaproteobacteria bacterium]|nr:thiosulfate oxidation carrier protein SoxY [Alphaproteobacteria bacterium]